MRKTLANDAYVYAHYWKPISYTLLESEDQEEDVDCFKNAQKITKQIPAEEVAGPTVKHKSSGRPFRIDIKRGVKKYRLSLWKRMKKQPVDYRKQYNYKTISICKVVQKDTRV